MILLPEYRDMPEHSINKCGPGYVGEAEALQEKDDMTLWSSQWDAGCPWWPWASQNDPCSKTSFISHHSSAKPYLLRYSSCLCDTYHFKALLLRPLLPTKPQNGECNSLHF